MPIVGSIFGNLDFSNMYAILGDVPVGAGVPVLTYGNFITIAINFIILAFIIFQMVKAMNKLKKEEPAAAPAPTPDDIVLLREIRDALKK
ncbi:UNVERIFIED_CONTAM: hypothetical protein GTU68_063413 [Idotea baltica]|nr:hypothetical protein [Idotea baltica]